jgi:O-antigen/teichoic acid export membrane protein
MTALPRVVFRNSVFGYGAQLLVKVLSFGFSVLIVRNLGVESYGQYAAILAFGAVFVFLADLGLSPFLVREVASMRDRVDGEAASQALFGDVLPLRLALSVITACVVIGAAWITERPPQMLLAIALGGLGLIMYGAHGTADAMLAGHERLDLSAGARVLNQVLFVALGGLTLWLGAGYFGLIGANLAGIALMTWACWRALKRLHVSPHRPVLTAWPRLIRRALPFGLIAFTLGLSYKLDSVLLSFFRGDAETGLYAAAYSLVFSIVVLSNVMNTALYPSLSRAAASTPAILPGIYNRALRYLILMALPISAGICILADPLVHQLFGAQYSEAASTLRIIIWVVPLMFASEFLGYVVVVQGRENRVARALLISTTFNVVFNLLLIPRYGLLAAAAMTVLTEAVLVTQYAWTLRSTLRTMHWDHILVRPAVATLAMCACVYGLRGAPLFSTIAVGAAVYLGLAVVLGIIGRDEIRFLRGLRSPGLVPSTETTYASS